ncbi:M48 family metallopeptidase [candidate division KSB1 bacterium]|nr:M48 family metallopeptidase [candidate division KSB1 bacterium]NIR70495.1 M48 family metallopeptidase [candidate division KSB1 bacterium]NIS27670.1 M48 family metallopeptidase [candidate division KSB1 bacterium]NIT74505.1 M48 family metallopeptidase [candidate division KSB1 bacterium]NIU23744.1 M48 family metallopeptidase [candidate division KSB1 bacterium]
MAKRKRKAQGSTALEVEGIGVVIFRKSHRARHVNIRVKPFAGVQVSVPRGISFTQAAELVKHRKAWVNRSLEKLKKLEGFTIIYDGTKSVSTRQHKLHVSASRDGDFSIRITNGRIEVRHPSTLKVTDQPVQAAILKGLVEAYRIEAKEYLPKRLKHLAELHGFRYNKVFIKNHKSRWGSCSERNNINLNLHLMSLSDELIDYVLLHELVHTKVKNHSPAFWRLFGSICENAKILDRRLRKHTILHS